jgi:hypothetical protein
VEQTAARRHGTPPRCARQVLKRDDRTSATLCKGRAVPGGTHTTARMGWRNYMEGERHPSRTRGWIVPPGLAGRRPVRSIRSCSRPIRSD